MANRCGQACERIWEVISHSDRLAAGLKESRSRVFDPDLIALLERKLDEADRELRCHDLAAITGSKRGARSRIRSSDA